MEPNNQQDQQNTPAPQAPLIPESELKMPEESVGNINQSSRPSDKSFNHLLIILLVLLLGLLAAVIVWGEEIIGLILPETTVELPPLPEAESQNNAMEEDFFEIENELNSTELSNFEAELESIEAELEAELSSGTSTQE